MSAQVELRDGRQLKAPVTVEPPRPQVTLLSKGTQDEASAAPSPVHLGSADDLPVEERLVFFLKSQVPAKFPRDEKVEVAATDGSFSTLLALADGSLMLEDAKTAMGTWSRWPASARRPLGRCEVRAMSADGVTGDWLPLGTLVRLPGFKELRCPRALAKPCTLTGSNLFLADSIAATPDLDNATEVPPEFTGTQLSVPHPVNGVLYLKLRDDPDTAQTLTIPVTPTGPLPAVEQPVAARRGSGSGSSGGCPGSSGAGSPAAATPAPGPEPAVKAKPSVAEPQQLALLEIGSVLLGEVRFVFGQAVDGKDGILRANFGAVSAVDALVGVDEDLGNRTGGRIARQGRDGGGGTLVHANKILGAGIGNYVSHKNLSLFAAAPWRRIAFSHSRLPGFVPRAL